MVSLESNISDDSYLGIINNITELAVVVLEGLHEFRPDDGLFISPVLKAREALVIPDPHRLADKGGDKRRLRVFVDFQRSSGLFHPARVGYDDLVGNLHRLVLVVGHENAGNADLMNHLLQPAAQLLPDLGVDRGEGLIQEQEPRFRRQSSGKGNPLSLPSGQLVRIALFKAAEPG